MPAPSQVQSHARFPLTSLLGSAGNVRVLRALAAAGSPSSVPRLAEAAGLTPQGTRLVLESLLRPRLAKVHGSGRTRGYELDRSHPLAAPLASLLLEEARRWDGLLASIRKVLDRHGAAVEAAWLYGSVARGEDSPESDLDIALVVRAHAVADRIRDGLMALEDAQQVRISLTALTPRELSALPDDDPWWSGIVRDARVLKGPAPEQARRRFAKGAR